MKTHPIFFECNRKKGMGFDLEIRVGFDGGRTRLKQRGREEGGCLKALEHERDGANRDEIDAAAISRS